MCLPLSVFHIPWQNFDIQVEDVRIRAILSSLRKRIPVTEGYVEVKDGGKWKQICNNDWSHFNSRVICGMFGFPGERKYNARVYKWVLTLGKVGFYLVPVWELDHCLSFWEEFMVLKMLVFLSFKKKNRTTTYLPLVWHTLVSAQVFLQLTMTVSAGHCLWWDLMTKMSGKAYKNRQTSVGVN